MSNKLSNNFYLSEFTRKGLPKNLNINQETMLDSIVNNILQPTRDELGKGIKITDCCRDLKKMQSLKKRGYNPSTTSDHFWGAAIPLSGAKKRKVYGPMYYYSAGAVDIAPSNYSNRDCWELFETMLKMSKAGKIKVGQLIFEWNPRRRVAWIHASNPAQIIYSKSFMKAYPFLRKTKYLTSVDNGKTYKVYR